MIFSRTTFFSSERHPVLLHPVLDGHGQAKRVAVEILALAVVVGELVCRVEGEDFGDEHGGDE
jgi:hypothetical protein